MLISIVPIGNSKGIRIPKSILEQLQIKEMVELEVHEKELLIKPVTRKPREGWADSFSDMKRRGEDELLIPELTAPESFEWEW